ncbi:MAG: hypothetical protein AAFY70_12325 [Bacteroidota bacterium]
MTKMDEKVAAYTSPGEIHRLDFILEGEIRFGPMYYKLKLDGKWVKDRIFGLAFTWHLESTYLALQEWLTTSYPKGPMTALTIVDLSTQRFARISKAEQGFIKPLRFIGESIIFQKEYLTSGKTVEYEINYTHINNWEKA